LEVAMTVGFEECVETLGLLCRQQKAPVGFKQRQPGALVNDLQRLTEVLPSERRVQRRVAVDDLLPCAREARRIQMPAQVESQLRYVHTRLRRVKAVKEQSLLRR